MANEVAFEIGIDYVTPAIVNILHYALSIFIFSVTYC